MTLYKTAFFSGLCCLSFAVHSDMDPSKLIKVTKDNNPQCVEYYNMQGEMYCSTTILNNTPIDPKLAKGEKQKIIFDKRPWQAVWGEKTEEITTIEYLPAGDKIENWKELVTSQFVPDIQDEITPQKYMDSVVENLKKTGFNPEIKLLEDTPEYVIFEFRILSPENFQQDELQKIMKGKEGFYILHYVIKKPDMGEKERELWLNNLKNSSVK
jgi:hypothetical protein